MLRKEIEPCIKIEGDKKPSVFKVGTYNIPEHTSPDHDELYSEGYSDLVVCTRIIIPFSDGLIVTEKILKQWEGGQDAALRFPNTSGESNRARIVGFDSPSEDDNYPGSRAIIIYFEWDKELFIGKWQAPENEVEMNIQHGVNSLALNDLMNKKVDEYGDLLKAGMMDKEVVRECAEEYGRYSLTCVKINGAEIRNFSDWEGNIYQEMEWTSIMEDVNNNDWSSLSNRLVVDAAVESNDNEDSKRREDVLRTIASLI